MTLTGLMDQLLTTLLKDVTNAERKSELLDIWRKRETSMPKLIWKTTLIQHKEVLFNNSNLSLKCNTTVQSPKLCNSHQFLTGNTVLTSSTLGSMTILCQLANI